MQGGRALTASCAKVGSPPHQCPWAMSPASGKRLSTIPQKARVTVGAEASR